MENTREQVIRQATSALLRAVNASDLEAVMAVWDDSGTLMPPGHASVQGHQAIKAYFEQLFNRNRFEFVFTSSQISVDGTLAVERVLYSAAAWSLEGDNSYRDSGKGVHVYRQHEGGSWKLVMDIWNSDGPDSSPAEDSSPIGRPGLAPE
jgi:ketosteroid isomerase-like protein